MKKINQPSYQNAPIVILVRPQLAENMGMVARAMMNCCLSELRLVSPRDNHLSEKAISASSGAQIILENATCFNTLEDALKDINYVLATSARKRDMVKDVYRPEQGIEILNKNTSNQTKCALLFGAERTGLENKEIVFANAIVEIPLNPLHASLNLSQAVLLVGYEWLKSQQNPSQSTQNKQLKSATQEEVNAFLHHLENLLDKRGYFRFLDKKERMSHNLRNIFLKNQLTTSEIKTLHKVIMDLTRPENQ